MHFEVSVHGHPRVSAPDNPVVGRAHMKGGAKADAYLPGVNVATRGRGGG